MDFRTIRPMVSKDLGLALEFLTKAKASKGSEARNTCIVSAEDCIRRACDAMGAKPGEKMFTWSLPAGKTQVTKGLTAADAANGLGLVIGWGDDQTVTVSRGDETFEAKLQAVRG